MANISRMKNCCNPETRGLENRHYLKAIQSSILNSTILAHLNIRNLVCGKYDSFEFPHNQHASSKHSEDNYLL